MPVVGGHGGDDGLLVGRRSGLVGELPVPVVHGEAAAFGEVASDEEAGDGGLQPPGDGALEGSYNFV